MSNGLNKVLIIGNLGSDPEIKYTSSGSAVANLSIATSERWKDRNTGEQKEQVEWHRVVLFSRLAEIAEQYLKKGSKVKQGDTIGYVGSSGLATGPHLHYEFMIGNKHTDPVRVKFPSAEPVPANEIMSFNEIKDKYMLELSKTIERFQINE